jgi:hypothetical protein
LKGIERKQNHGANGSTVPSLVIAHIVMDIAGRHYPISLYEVLAANAVTYALVGLIVETLRHYTH